MGNNRVISDNGKGFADLEYLEDKESADKLSARKEVLEGAIEAIVGLDLPEQALNQLVTKLNMTRDEVNMFPSLKEKLKKFSPKAKHQEEVLKEIKKKKKGKTKDEEYIGENPEEIMTKAEFDKVKAEGIAEANALKSRAKSLNTKIIPSNKVKTPDPSAESFRMV